MAGKAAGPQLGTEAICRGCDALASLAWPREEPKGSCLLFGIGGIQRELCPVPAALGPCRMPPSTRVCLLLTEEPDLGLKRLRRSVLPRGLGSEPRHLPGARVGPQGCGGGAARWHQGRPRGVRGRQILFFGGRASSGRGGLCRCLTQAAVGSCTPPLCWPLFVPSLGRSWRK